MCDEGARRNIDNEPPLRSVTQTVNSSLSACKLSFSWTQKAQLIATRVITYRDYVKICASLFILYDKQGWQYGTVRLIFC